MSCQAQGPKRLATCSRALLCSSPATLAALSSCLNIFCSSYIIFSTLLRQTFAHIFSTKCRFAGPDSMGISSFSDLSPGLLPMLIIKAAILVAAIKQTLYSLFPSLGLIASNYNMEEAEYSDQHMHDDERGHDTMNISLGSQLTNLFSCEREILGKNPLLTLSSSFSSNRNEDCAVCFCSLGDGDEICELSCFHFFHRSCIAKWFHYQVLQPTCPVCRSAQVYDVMIERDELT